MAKNDMEVIIYKILRYLYECMKSGVRPQMEDICHDCQMFSIPEAYWYLIMKELIDNGFIKGFINIETKSGTIIQTTKASRLTLKGREYLRDNSGMQNAKDMVGEAFEIVLEGMIKALLP